MDNKTTGIVATIVTALLCGLPGLFGLCIGLMFTVVSQIPGSDINLGGSSEPKLALITGLVILIVSVIFIAIPIVVGIITLRKKPSAEVITPQSPIEPGEPIPPAI
ncbi:MAG: hypothetical protein ABFD53_00420 [Anaerolineaceae bacterium]